MVKIDQYLILYSEILNAACSCWALYYIILIFDCKLTVLDINADFTNISHEERNTNF